MRTKIISALALLVFSLVQNMPAQAPAKYDFGPDFIPVYTQARGFGFINVEKILAVPTDGNQNFSTGALASEKPFLFAIDLPEGNYDVTIQLGNPKAASDTTVKAEGRRLMLESIKTEKGASVTRTFTVNIRTPELPGGRKVSLKEREAGTLRWDGKLTLEFNGPHPAIAGLEIKRNDTALTVFLAGDSTVTDQQTEPWSSWGQMIPRFFAVGTSVSNFAESGLTLGSFRKQNRLEKILTMLKPRDYVFIQFGHNDMKEKGGGAFTTYAENLRQYIDAIVEKQGKPVLVTPMYRRRFDKAGKLVNTHGDYPEAVRRVAKEKKVPCIDLHAMSGRVFSALGEEGTKAAFVFYPANTFPNQSKPLSDNSHFCDYGAYELARCVVEGIRTNVPDLAARLMSDVGKYNPDHPANPKSFVIPSSPSTEEVVTPDGS